MPNFTYILQFIEYYTRLTQERHRVDDNEGVEKKEAKRKAKQEKKELKKKNEKLKMKKVNPHNAYGNFLTKIFGVYVYCFMPNSVWSCPVMTYLAFFTSDTFIVKVPSALVTLQ